MSIQRGTLVLAVIASFAAASRSQSQAFAPPTGKNVGPVLTLVSAKERGQRLVVIGRLFASDGSAPLARRWIGAYQTDASGNYGHDARVHTWARLNGWLRTDSLGRYEIRTIRPGAYPQGSTPEHIHFVIETPRGFEGNTELRFEDDRRVSTSEVTASRRYGRFGTVRPVTRGQDGVLRVERDLREP